MEFTRVEINQDNLNHNVAQFKKIAPDSQIWPVIKSNAYGHGTKEIVSILNQNEQVSGYMVVNLSEAIEVSVLTNKPILVLSYFDLDDKVKLETAAAKQIALPIYDLETARSLNELAAKNNWQFLVNIKIDTGTSRLGFSYDEAGEIIKQIKSFSNLKIFSVFSHYAESESDNLDFSKGQLEKLKNITNDLDAKIHSACSAAAVGLPGSRQDFIRLGVSLYGLWPSQATAQRGREQGINLKPILSWKTKIIQVKNIKAGESIGYNRTHQCQLDCKIAVLPVGYYEGYSRLLSNQGQVLIRGNRCPIRGNICMNLTMVELPKDMDIKRGEDVVLLGSQEQETVSAEDIASWSQTINYEVTTRINSKLSRKIV